MTKTSVEKHLIPFLQQTIVILNGDKMLRTGRLLIFNIKDFTIQLTLQKSPGSRITYEMPYPYNITTVSNVASFDYTLDRLAGNDSLLRVKMNLCKPDKANKFYNTSITLKKYAP